MLEFFGVLKFISMKNILNFLKIYFYLKLVFLSKSFQSQLCDVDDRDP